MPNQTMVYSCSGAEQEYTMVWFGIFLYLLVSSLKIRFCEQSVFAKSPLQGVFLLVPPKKCWRLQNPYSKNGKRGQLSLFCYGFYNLQHFLGGTNKKNLYVTDFTIGLEHLNMKAEKLENYLKLKDALD